MRIGLRILELAFGVIKAKGWKEIFTPFFYRSLIYATSCCLPNVSLPILKMGG